MRLPPTLKFSLILSLFAGALAITTPGAGTAQPAAPSKDYRSPVEQHKVQVRGDKLIKKMAKSGGRLVADYGAYQVWEVDSTTADSVRQDGDAQVRDEDNLVRLNTETIDTSRPEIQAQRQVCRALQRQATASRTICRAD